MLIFVPSGRVRGVCGKPPRREKRAPAGSYLSHLSLRIRRSALQSTEIPCILNSINRNNLNCYSL